MMTLPDLRGALMDLAAEIEESDIALIVGGGFGIYLKIEHVRRTGRRTLFGTWPAPRSTNDLDVFLRPELLTDSEKLRPLAEAITRLGYRAVPGAEKYQFIKPGPGVGGAGGVKIDILTGPQSCFKGTRVKADARRARPSPSVGLHAHPVDEAPTLAEGLLPVTFEERRRGGRALKAVVFLPHPFTFAMMKIFAFRDRLDDADKEFGRYHAMDLYAILATTTEEEWLFALRLRDRPENRPHVEEAGELVRKFFSSLDRPGMVRLQESIYFQTEFDLEGFMSGLGELFPATGVYPLPLILPQG